MPIDIQQLDESDIGRAVTYTASHGEREFGKVSSFNQKFVFVRYIRGPSSEYTAATDPRDLRFDFPPHKSVESEG